MNKSSEDYDNNDDNDQQDYGDEYAARVRAERTDT